MDECLRLQTQIENNKKFERMLRETHKIGKFKASLVFQLDDGISFDIDILANIIGPEISINTPLIDFGLFATSTIQKKEFEIENLTPIKVQ